MYTSDADRAALLTRWGSDGLDKLGGQHPSSQNLIPSITPVRPWVIHIKARVREVNQAHAIDEVVNALKAVQHCPANAEDAPLRVVNGSTQTSSIITVAARENVHFSTTDGIPPPDGSSYSRITYLVAFIVMCALSSPSSGMPEKDGKRQAAALRAR